MKKILALVLALCMVFVLAACGSNDGNDTVNDGSTPSDLMPVVSPTPTPVPEDITSLTIGGLHIIRDGQITGLGYRGCTYEDGTLTIDSVALTNDKADGPIISFEGGDLEIIVVGDCSMTSTGGASIISGGDSNLTISGDGTLTMSATGAAAIDLSGSLSVECALSATGEPACSSENVSAGDGYTVAANDGTTLTVSAAA